MRYKKIVFILLTTTVFVSCASKKETNEVKKFNWLLGSWIMREGESVTTEDWKSESDTTLAGSSAYVPKIGMDTVPFENVKFVYRNQNYYYIVTAAGKKEPPVEFKLTRFTDSSFIAENPAHDFPKRIGYFLINKDSVTAWIDGGSDSTDTKEKFYYSRKK